MIQALDTWAYVNHRHDRAIENAIFAGGLLLLAVLLPPFPSSLTIFVVSICAATFGARVPVRVLARAMAVPFLFIIIGILPMLLTVQYVEGKGPIVEIHRTGMIAALSVGQRTLGAAASLILLGVTTPISAQIEIFRRLRVPNVLLELMAMTYRMLFLFDGILVRMITAQASRLGYRNLQIGFRSGGMAVAGLLSRIPVRTQSMERGLAARGYSGDLTVLSTLEKPNPRRLTRIALVHVSILLVDPAWRTLFCE